MSRDRLRRRCGSFGGRVALAAAGTMLLLAACASQRRILSREALLRSLDPGISLDDEAVPSLSAVQSLRLPLEGVLASAVYEAESALAPRGALFDARLAMARGDVMEASRLWHTASATPWLELHRCLAEGVLVAGLPTACVRFLDDNAEHPAAAGAAAVLMTSRRFHSEVAGVLFQKGPQWIERCGSRFGSNCADLAYLVADALEAGADEDDEASELAARLRGGPAALFVEGPFRGDGLYTFATAGDGRDLEPLPTAWSTERAPHRGRYRPALRHAGGLFRLSGRFVASGDVTLYLRSRRAARIFLDGVEVAARSPDTEPVGPTTRAWLQLRPGLHRLDLLVVAESAADDVGVAILDARGAPVLHDAAPEAPGAGAGFSSRQVLLTSPTYGIEGTDDPLARLDVLLLEAALIRVGAAPNDTKTFGVLRRLLEDYPGVPSALAAAARLLAEAPRLPPALATGDALMLWHEVARRWPTHPEALLALAESITELQPLEALDRYRELQRSHPDLAVGHAGVLSLALGLDLASEAIGAADALAGLGMGPAASMLPLAVYERFERHKERARLEARTQIGGRLLAPERALAEGRVDEAISFLLEWVRAEEGSAAAELCWDTLAGQDPIAATSQVEEHLGRFPADRSAWRRLVALRAMRGELSGAQAAVREGLASAGADVAMWLSTVELGGEVPFAEDLLIGERLIDDYRRRGALLFPAHRYGFLRDHTQRQFFPDGSSLQLRHFLLELSSPEALDEFGELRFAEEDELLRLRVIKRDGSQRLPELIEGVDDLSFTGLEVGDLLEGLVVRAADLEEEVPCGELVPLVTEVPAQERSRFYDVPLAIVAQGFAPVAVGGAAVPEVATSEQEGRVQYRFVHANAPALAKEPHAPADVEVTPAVGYRCGGQEASWRVIRGASIWRAAKADPWLTAAAALVAGEGTRERRWRRLFHFIVTQVDEAESPVDAVAVLASGRGRRLPLLLALAKAADLEVRPIALHPPTSPPLSLGAAGAWPLLGVAASVGGRWSVALVDDGLALLDALPPALAASPVMDLSLAATPLDLDGDTLSDEPAGLKAALRAHAKGMEGYLAITVPPARAEGFRRWLRTVPTDEWRGALEAALSSSLPGLRVVEVSVPGLGATGSPLGIGLDVEVPWAPAPDGRVRLDGIFSYSATAPLGLFPSLPQFLEVSARQRPVLAVSSREVLELELELPEGAVFLDAPGPLEVDAGFVHLQQRAEVNEGTLRWNRELEVHNQRVSVEEWVTARSALTELVRRTEATLEILLPSPVRSPP